MPSLQRQRKNTVGSQALKIHSTLYVTLEAPERLDKFLVKHFPLSSRAYWKEHLSSLVRINGAKAKPSHLLKGGERLDFLQAPPLAIPRLKPNSEIKLKILYQDKDLIAVEKPASLACYPLDAEEENTLANALAATFPELMKFDERPLQAGLLHRLDNETSGVLLVGRNEEARKKFEKLAKQNGIRKYYLALVEGNLAGRGKITWPIYHHPKNKKKMCVWKGNSPEPKHLQKASTEFRAIVSNPRATCLLLSIDQGVRHQIRVHLAALGHPILGDKLYSAGHQKGNHTANRQMLHARSVSFVHPVSGKRCRIRSEIPEDFSAMMKTLGFK